MDVPSYFTDFLQDIRPTEEQRSELKDGHIKLRARLLEYEPLKRAIVTTFLQGSYRRATALRPAPKRRSDVDIVVVTRLHEDEYTPSAALELFRPFVRKYYKDQYRFQGRSIGITQPHADMDLVLTSSPPEQIIGVLPEEIDQSIEGEALAEQLKKAARSTAWKVVPLRIPNREAKRWQNAHPLAQIDWTREKNAATSGHYVNVVKAIKWWKYDRYPEFEKPQGYPLERIIAACCPDGIGSVAEGVTRALEEIIARFGSGKPVLPDHGTQLDVLHRLEPEDFHRFYGLVAAAAKLARRALDAEELEESVTLWRELFGERFPPPPKSDDEGPKGGFSPRTSPTVPGSGRFA
jgi:predicted nucleotidyltransferase